MRGGGGGAEAGGERGGRRSEGIRLLHPRDVALLVRGTGGRGLPPQLVRCPGVLLGRAAAGDRARIRGPARAGSEGGRTPRGPGGDPPDRGRGAAAG